MAHQYNLRGQYIYPNKRKTEILAVNPSNIPPYVDPKTEKQCLQNARNREKFIVSHTSKKKLERPVCRSEVIVSTLLKKDGSYVSDQERAATEGIHLKVLAHPNDAIRKVCGPENGKRVRDFSNATCSSSFGKSAHLWSCKLQRLSGNSLQVSTRGDKVPTFSDHVPHTQSD
ncbi:hypothetical protein Ahy_A06g029234 isoform A [Arachis hypogaea]|uniref:Uncharacterized protein n=1 Tax=Arachis hypogaea TaxID=3818 RepID=A0A445CSR6_ARAHY|nr:hypothetical protein Ahy_A06g029234 isoform A [Arachis hypogaea]